MAYCGPRAIPYESWLSWSPLSRAAAIAWLEDQEKRCPTCGEYEEDWALPDGSEVREKPKHPAEFMCFSCRDIGVFEEAKEKHRSAHHEERPHGVRTVLVPASPIEPGEGAPSDGV